MRTVVFTGRQDLTATPFWEVLCTTRGIDSILICQQVRERSLRAALKSLRRNLRRHGLLFVPYRLWHLMISVFGPPPHGQPFLRRGSRIDPEIITFEKLNSEECIRAVSEWRPDLGLSIGAPIMREPLFEIPRLGTLNIHGGRVPDFRGAPPGFWELYSGVSEIGATLHWVTAKLDAGDVVATGTAQIYPHDTFSRVSDRAEELSVHVLSRGLEAVVSGRDTRVPQPPGGRTYRSPTVANRMRLQLRLFAGRLRRLGRSPGVLLKNTVLWVLGFAYRPIRDGFRTLLRRHPVRVFTLHRVTSLCRDGMTVAPDVFRRQIRFLKATHDVRSLSEAMDLVRKRTRLRRPVAVLTFDDGYRSVLERALPIMQEEGVPGTCFVSTAFVGTEQRFPHDVGSPVEEFLDVMTWDELRELLERGWEIGTHTRTHARVSELQEPTLPAEIEGPIQDVVQHLGVRPTAFAYPYGGDQDISREAEDAVGAAGYVAAFQDYGGDVKVDSPHLRLPRIELGGDHSGPAWRTRAAGFSLRTILGSWGSRRR